MKAIHRFRRAEQLRFFDRNRVLPLWSSLAEDVRQAVTRLTAEMLREHWATKSTNEVERRTKDE